MDNPDVVCFSVGEIEFESFEERKVWMVEVDMRKKACATVLPRLERGQPRRRLL